MYNSFSLSLSHSNSRSQFFLSCASHSRHRSLFLCYWILSYFLPDLFKSQQERELTYSKSSKRERATYSKSSKRERERESDGVVKRDRDTERERDREREIEREREIQRDGNEHVSAR